jgi:hypothetical protein
VQHASVHEHLIPEVNHGRDELVNVKMLWFGFIKDKQVYASRYFGPKDLLMADALPGVTMLYQPFEAETEREAFLYLIRRQETT